MPRGGARPGAGRPKDVAGQLRAMQRLNVEVKRDIESFKNSLKAGFAEGIAELAVAFPSIMRLRIQRALAGDEKAADMLIALYTRFFQPDTLITESSHPITDYARQIREELLKAASENTLEVIDVEARVVEHPVADRSENPSSADGDNADARDGRPIL